MIIRESYTGTAPDQVLAFADGGLPELMGWLESTTAKMTDGISEPPYGFNGFSTWADVVKMTKHGWTEGASRIAHNFGVPAFGKSNKRPHWAYDIAGDMPDVGRYLAGAPNHMVRRKVDKGRKPVVTLYIGMGVRATITTEQFTNFGIAVCEMIDALENNGTRVELNQLTRASMGSRHCVTGWRVKEADAHLDLSALAFTYMHPAAHRRLQFQMRARFFNGVGGSTFVGEKDFPDAPVNALVLPGISDNAGRCRTLAGAREFLRENINEAAGTEIITLDMVEHLH